MVKKANFMLHIFYHKKRTEQSKLGNISQGMASNWMTEGVFPAGTKWGWGRKRLAGHSGAAPLHHAEGIYLFTMKVEH